MWQVTKTFQSLNNYWTLNNKQQQTVSAQISNSNTHLANDHQYKREKIFMPKVARKWNSGHTGCTCDRSQKHSNLLTITEPWTTNSNKQYQLKYPTQIHISRMTINKSARKYLCQKLLENEIPDTQAVHVTGQKNIQSLNNYRTLNNKQQQIVSAQISNSNTHLANDHHPAVSFTSNSVTSSARNNLSWNTSCMSNDPMHSLFNGSTINGGNCSINMYFCSHGQAAAGTCTNNEVNKFGRDVRLDDDIW